MIKRKYTSKSKCLKLCALFLFPFALFGGVSLYKTATIGSSDAAESFVPSNVQSVAVTNANFQDGGRPFVKGDSLSGWNAIETENKATGMIIDVGQGENTGDSSETETFSKNSQEYMLSVNPGAHSSSDSRILMINSKENYQQKNVQAYKGYRSSSISLEANSFYIFSLSAKALKNDDNTAFGSIYVNGLVDKDGDPIKLGYESFDNEAWQEFYIFVATGDSAQNVTLDLYLGTNDGKRSQGAVFFDNVNVNRCSHNEFFESALLHGYKNDNKLVNYQDSNKDETVFLVNELAPTYYLIEGSENYNFDFEDKIPENTDTLGEHWQIIPGGLNNGQAMIINNRDINYFTNTTGYQYAGYDLNYDNTQSLVLWTNNNDYSVGGYVGVKSDDIMIEAHGIYKVSLKMKFAGINSGSFYLNVAENDYIYSAYPTLLSGDSDAHNYYQLTSGKTSGISSNVTNAWTNDYQTVELYIKGHNLFNTSVNLELWLGDMTTSAEGCVVIDDIKVERATYSAFSSASNQYELKYIDVDNSTFNNVNFDGTENESLEGKYPVAASGWTTEKENDKINESGVIYLAGNDEYDRLYNKLDNYNNKVYAWAGINPDSGKTTPNNVYMMFNSENSYQSITSSSYSLSPNSYYKLTFDYYNQAFRNLNSSNINVEITDENGIVLFSKSGISSLDNWAKMEIYIHTAETVSHSIKVKISLGDSENKVGGMVYLDNINIDANETYGELFNDAKFKTDLGNYYLNLNDNLGSIVTNSPAYSLSVDEVYDSNYTTSDNCAIGGIVSGKNNSYGIENENNLLVLTNIVACRSSLKTNYKLTLNEGSYYELSFDLATFFGDKAGTSDKEHECKYGLKVTIEGYESIEKLVSKEELQNYKIYLHSQASATPTITFTLISDCDNTTGTAIITNINFVTSDENKFSAVASQPGYDKTVFKATVENKADTGEDDEPDTGDTDTETSNDNLWILIPSLIMAVALIVAIVGIALRKVKIKKIERVKKEAYDKKIKVNSDALMLEAEKIRDKEAGDIKLAISKLSEKRDSLENEHKTYVNELAKENDGKLSKDVEKAFKKYESDKVRLDEKINILNEKLSYTMTADYLLTLERKVLAEKDEQRSLEKKAKKAEQKEAKKIEKKKID